MYFAIIVEKIKYLSIHAGASGRRPRVDLRLPPPPYRPFRRLLYSCFPTVTGLSGVWFGPPAQGRDRVGNLI